MNETVSDTLDFDEYEVEQTRMHRHNKRMAVIYACEEMGREEKEIENEFISD